VCPPAAAGDFDTALKRAKGEPAGAGQAFASRRPHEKRKMTMTDTSAPQTLFEKIWSRHRIMERPDGQVLLYIDSHLVQDGSAPAFEMLRRRGLAPRVPERTFATPDHYVPTDSRDLNTIADPEKRRMAQALMQDSARAGIPFFGLDDARQGIVHVVGPEQGLSWPGTIIVCGDSHTSTHGAMGALAFGIGATEVSHVLATQSLWQRKPKTMRISVDGPLGAGVSAKDIVLSIIGKIGTAGATGHVVEYAGSTITELTMEGRLTVCNMSIEAGARAGMIAPDDTTFQYLAGRPYAPAGQAWEEAVALWRTLPSHPGATFDREVALDARAIQPMVTWGNSPEDVIPITGRIPDPGAASDAGRREALTRSLSYMDLRPGMSMTDVTVDHVFIGSCTNGRIEDLRSAAAIVKGRKVADGVQAWAVPGSGLVKAQAEAEGLDRILTDAGFQWRYAGCSMCLGTNGDMVAAGKRCASTTNRNFVGRQGPGSRTHLVSPLMAAAAAVTGRFTDVRQLMKGA
jgi:3-isopropylmalate/(R)-2-methylmalate dehydratase large subunit